MTGKRDLDLAAAALFGHLLAEPFFDVTTHVLPRAAFLLFLLVLPRSADRWCLEAHRTREPGG